MITKPNAPKNEYHVSIEEVKKLLDYDPITGVFTWKFRYPPTYGNNIFNAKFAGKIAGGRSTNSGEGYIRIKIFGKVIKAHRIVIAMVEGAWPNGYVDHINGDIVDNRYANLRVVEKIENGRNQKLYNTNKSGVPGVRWSIHKQAWEVSIGGNGTKYFEYLGNTKDLLDAVATRYRAERLRGYHKNHGRIMLTED